MLPQGMRDTMERLRQNVVAVGVDADEMKAKLDETVETIVLSSFFFVFFPGHYRAFRLCSRGPSRAAAAAPGEACGT